MYVNCFDRVKKLTDVNPTVGILLWTTKNDTAVNFPLPEENTNGLASKHKKHSFNRRSNP